MKKYQLLGFMLALVLMLSLMPIGASAETTQFDPYYCRSALGTLPNAKALVYAYDQIVSGVEASLSEIEIYNGTDPITADEVRTVIDAYRRDHTEHFWFGNSYSMSYNSSTVLKVIPTYVMEGETLAQARQAFDAAIDRMLAEVATVTDEFERELLLHDRLATTVTYVESANAHNAYGALVEGRAVCEGYAEALQCLLHRAGIQSLIVLGSSVNPSTGQPEGHAWNMVRIGGSYYHTDLTWNDQGRTLYHAYFNQTDARIREDHAITETAYALPACTSQAANYFKVRGGLLDEYTVDSVAELLKNNGLSVSVYLSGSVDAFLSWYRENLNAIAQKAGVRESYTSTLSGLGREYRLSIEVCQHSSLQAVAARAVSCTENGNEAYYVCSCGKWFEDAAAEREIVYHDSVLIYSQGHQWTEKIEDAMHLKASATDCRNGNAYWYDCAACDVISNRSYFYDEKVGDHVYAKDWSEGDETGHWHTCIYCDAHDDAEPHVKGAPATEEAPETCSVCGYELAPMLKGETQTVAKPQGGSQNGGSSSSGGDFVSLPSLGGCVVTVSDVGALGLAVLLSLLALKKKQRS